MNRWHWPALGLVGLLALNGCGEETATGVGGGLIPLDPQTFEFDLSWSEFGGEAGVFGGFGRVSELPQAFLAHTHQGVVEARILSRFADYPESIQVPDQDGDVQTDDEYTFAGGRIIAVLDTAGLTDPMAFEVHRPPGGWDPVSVNWNAAVDTLGEQVLWEEAGAGPTTLAGEGVWDPTENDTLFVELDTTTIRQLGDTARLRPGIRLDVATPGAGLALQAIALEVDALPSIREDTVVTFQRAALNLAFIYTPPPGAPADGQLRVGGAPAWRTVVGFDLDPVLQGPPSLCAQLGCPFELDPTRLSAATLVLTSGASPPGFQPMDSIRIDTRSVLADDRLPKAPLGGSMLGGVGIPLAPEAFGPDGAGESISVPVTSFLRTMLGEDTDEGDPPASLALLAPLEPLSLSLASFAGPGQPGEPVLRLVLTTSDTVHIR